MADRQIFRESIQAEVDLFDRRLDEFIERSDQDDAQARDEKQDDIRGQRAATLALEFFDMLDSLDHRTSAMGTDRIQTLAMMGRELVVQFRTTQAEDKPTQSL